MPELPEVESVKRRIAPAMLKASITSVDVRRPDLRTPFPRQFARRLSGQTVIALTRRAKYLLALLSSGETLLMHLGMSGSIRVVREGSVTRNGRTPATNEPHDHVVFHLSSGKAVVFNDPRRFGTMDLIPQRQLATYATLQALGPEPLADSFDAGTLARACRGKKTSLKAALLDQRVVAGLGNIYASEALHVAGLSPRRPASILATSSGAPREPAYRLVAAIKQVLLTAIERQSTRLYSDDRFLVYDREGEYCARKGCGGTIRRTVQGGRATFYCRICQR